MSKNKRYRCLSHERYLCLLEILLFYLIPKGKFLSMGRAFILKGLGLRQAGSFYCEEEELTDRLTHAD